MKLSGGRSDDFVRAASLNLRPAVVSPFVAFVFVNEGYFLAYLGYYFHNNTLKYKDVNICK